MYYSELGWVAISACNRLPVRSTDLYVEESWYRIGTNKCHHRTTTPTPMRTCRGATNSVQWLAQTQTSTYVGTHIANRSLHGVGILFVKFYLYLTCNIHFYGWNVRPYLLNWRSMQFTAALCMIFLANCSPISWYKNVHKQTEDSVRGAVVGTGYMAVRRRLN